MFTELSTHCKKLFYVVHILNTSLLLPRVENVS